MDAIICRDFWLYPVTDRHLVLVIAYGGRFLWRPKLGIYKRKDKAYFVLAFGKLYCGMRLIEDGE